MTKEEALYQFWSSFGLTAYDEAAVPDGTAFPYITYQSVTNNFIGGDTSMTASVWYRSESWEAPARKAEEIANFIGAGGIYWRDIMWIKQGEPFSQSMGDSEDKIIKRKVINITVQFLTNN